MSFVNVADLPADMPGILRGLADTLDGLNGRQFLPNGLAFVDVLNTLIEFGRGTVSEDELIAAIDHFMTDIRMALSCGAPTNATLH